MAGTATSGPGLRHQRDVGGRRQRRAGHVGDPDRRGTARRAPTPASRRSPSVDAGLRDRHDDGVGEVEPRAVVGRDARGGERGRARRRRPRAGSARRSRRCRSTRGPPAARGGGPSASSRRPVALGQQVVEGAPGRGGLLGDLGGHPGGGACVSSSWSLTRSARRGHALQLVRTRPYQWIASDVERSDDGQQARRRPPPQARRSSATCWPSWRRASSAPTRRSRPSAS